MLIEHRIQDFVNAQPKRMQCLEGAILGASVLYLYGHRPILLDLRANAYDYDHVVAPFQVDGYWGAISKTKYPVLRFREPIYKSIRELAMSYFHEYFLDTGEKSLRSYSEPFDLVEHFGSSWFGARGKYLQHISKILDRYPHHEILTKKMKRNLRPVDFIEVLAGKVREK